MTNLLILGGTTEATVLAQAVAAKCIPATLSYAGRVAEPRAQPIPIRVGGFGGIEGLLDYLRFNRITHLIDATHPFAAQMSNHAVAACAQTGTPLLAYVRPPWRAEPGDLWQHVPTIEAAADALNGPAKRIFLAIGRQHLAAFASQPQHHYLLRLIDIPQDLPLPQSTTIIARGPFDLAGDLALLQTHRTETIIAKNAGGFGAEAKILAARHLGIPVILIDRPAIPDRPTAATLAQVMGWIAHPTLLGV